MPIHLFFNIEMAFRSCQIILLSMWDWVICKFNNIYYLSLPLHKHSLSLDFLEPGTFSLNSKVISSELYITMAVGSTSKTIPAYFIKLFSVFLTESSWSWNSCPDLLHWELVYIQIHIFFPHHPHEYDRGDGQEGQDPLRERYVGNSCVCGMTQ